MDVVAGAAALLPVAELTDPVVPAAAVVVGLLNAAVDERCIVGVVISLPVSFVYDAATPVEFLHESGTEAAEPETNLMAAHCSTSARYFQLGKAVKEAVLVWKSPPTHLI